MMYGLYISYVPFLNMDNELYIQQIKMSRAQGYKLIQNLLPYVPTPFQRTSVAFCFMICLSVGIAIFGLCGFHFYLTLTGQTTIEFHSNWSKKKRAEECGLAFVNPYDLGYRRNWQQVFGRKNVFLSILVPSMREPEFLPVALADDVGRRRRRQRRWIDVVAKKKSDDDNDDGSEYGMGGDSSIEMDRLIPSTESASQASGMFMV